MAAVAGRETAMAFSARARAGRAGRSPASVLFLVDRSRSVGLPGLAAERDLARAPAGCAAAQHALRRAVLRPRPSSRLFPMIRPATREAMEAFETEMVPDRLQNGTDLAGALREAGALLRREASAFAPRALLVVLTDGALPADRDGAALDARAGRHCPRGAVCRGVHRARGRRRARRSGRAPGAAARRGEARGGVAREVRTDDDRRSGARAARRHLAAAATCRGARVVAAARSRARLRGARCRPARASCPASCALPGTDEIARPTLVGVTRGSRMHAALRPMACRRGLAAPARAGPPRPGREPRC